MYKKYLPKIKNYHKNYYFFYEQKFYFNIYFKLRDKLNIDNSIINQEKKFINHLLLKRKTEKINNIKNIFYTSSAHFGNLLSILNKLIFYCEIIGCKKIILDKKKFWFLKNVIYIPKYNITLEINQQELNKNNYIYYNSNLIFYSYYKIKPEVRIHFLRNEIIKNIPKIISNKLDLFIHIRSGDIFSTKPSKLYAQPPLCFYKKIISNYKFNKIYIITQNINNPLISKLIRIYHNIFFTRNSIKYDISYLIYAYNIVCSISSFLMSIIQLNNNLIFLWDYNIYHISEKNMHYHYDLYKLPYNKITLFRMESSSNYRKIMYLWKNNRKQRKLMIKEKCINDFSIINKQI